MQGTTGRRVDQPWLVVLHALAVLSLLGLALLGQVPAEVAGWLILPAVAGGGGGLGRPAGWVAQWRALGDYLAASWPPVLLRSLLLWGLWAWSGDWGWSWLRLVPWGLWLWRGLGVGWPRLAAGGLAVGAEGVLARAAARAGGVSGGGAEPARAEARQLGRGVGLPGLRAG